MTTQSNFDGSLFDEVGRTSEAVIRAHRVMYYATHEWPGWGDEDILAATEALRNGPSLADKLQQFAASNGRIS